MKFICFSIAITIEWFLKMISNFGKYPKRLCTRAYASRVASVEKRNEGIYRIETTDDGQRVKGGTSVRDAKRKRGKRERERERAEGRGTDGKRRKVDIPRYSHVAGGGRRAVLTAKRHLTISRANWRRNSNLNGTRGIGPRPRVLQSTWIYAGIAAQLSW